MGNENYKHSEITEKVIKAFYQVYNTLGYGFLEKVYENALLIELQKMGLHAAAQHPIKVYYQEKQVGSYFADLFVENCVIVELKANESIVIENEYQLVNYLKATNIEIGLLLNFGKSAQFKKRLFQMSSKMHLVILNHKNHNKSAFY